MKRILVLGAYGLAGRAIVAQLLRTTPHHVILAGRRVDKLAAIAETCEAARVSVAVVDAVDKGALRRACAEADLVINAVGPYARFGADIARTVIETGRRYVDCANEQVHYRRLQDLDATARTKGVPLVTAAGVIPGASTLLAAHLLTQFPDATGVHTCWLQLRHAYEETGLGSTMGGILEAAQGSADWQDGKLQPVVMGKSMRTFETREPFGARPLMEVPTIDALVLPERYPLRDVQSWFYLGDLPTWLLGLIRRLQPHRRPWAYKLIESVMRRINDAETRKAVAEGIGPEGLLWVAAHNRDCEQSAWIRYQDGAIATALLPVQIAQVLLSGGKDHTGLLTPLDLIDPTPFLTLQDNGILDRNIP